MSIMRVLPYVMFLIVTALSNGCSRPIFTLMMDLGNGPKRSSAIADHVSKSGCIKLHDSDKDPISFILVTKPDQKAEGLLNTQLLDVLLSVLSNKVNLIASTMCL